MKKEKIIPKGIVFPFILLITLFFAWAIPNNLTDTMLSAFKRIMSFNDSKTAWIQVVCYLLGYGCFAIPGAMFIKKHTYKSGVILGLSLYSLGALMFYPAMLSSEYNMDLCFFIYLFAILILFAGLSILETSTNSFVCAIGPASTATQRLNFAQSFNPFGAISGVIISQVFILSQLNTMTASGRRALAPEQLFHIQTLELNAVTVTYVLVGFVMLALLFTFLVTRMPDLKEDDKNLDFKGTFKRLMKNKQYVWGVIAQFFYVGAQIAVWSFVIRYSMQQLNFDNVIYALGNSATTDSIIHALRNVEPLARGFYNICDSIGLDALLPRTPEQAGATYYIISLIMFVIARFVCTWLMKFFKPRNILTILAVLAVFCCLGTIFGEGRYGVYSLIGISACMSLMFPTIYGQGIAGLGEDTKIGGAGMITAIAGAAVLTQVQGIISDQSGSIVISFVVPTIAFFVIAYYGAFVIKTPGSAS